MAKKIIINEVERIFALSFGYGKHLLKKDVYEERFGIITALNLIGEKTIRTINKTSIGTTNKSAREQMPKQSGINDFGFDINSDLIGSISAKSENESIIEGIITGGESFSCSANVNQDNITDFLMKIYNAYTSDNYKANFSWVDKIQPVKSNGANEKLNLKMIESINLSEEKFWMAVPEVIDWENVKGFKISNDRNIHDDILINKVMESFKRPLDNISQLRSKTIDVISSLNEESIIRWKAIDCIYGEIDLDDKSYCISNGKWFEIDSDYVSEINREYLSTPISEVNFIDNPGLNEDKYNEKLVNENSGFLLMDKELIVYGGGHSSIELCDIITIDNKLIHIKKYGGSSVLGHLFNQAVVSTRLIKSDKKFVIKANEKINNHNYEINLQKEYEIIIAIISDDENEIPHIPFFAKIAFMHAYKTLLTMSVDVKIKRVKNVRIESNV
ncbi:DUF6119 family protein [Haploplasma axanthum]|uniref:Sporadically distributed protein n=1 Tax=Haploplasma axanthum TaxID=29552 RepID=A0A449BBU6_HAPAX|nr:DUF6119 family protein [Haploplasma axanthum]VEU79908.1 sporadically distributed protein [Haploplasma axanthum]